jgi:microcystin degradation protein MlrC
MHWRIAVGGIWHETNTFAPGHTGIGACREYQYPVGEEVLSRYAGTNTELGGMIGVADELGLELVPTIYAGAVPSGTITRDALERLCGELRTRLRGANSVDGVLVVLHGAAVAEGVDDADAHVLAVIREVLGPTVPVAGTFDFHANLSATMVSLADLLVGYDTYPHVDMAERGREAALLLARILETRRRPVCTLRKVPLVTVPQVQATETEPMRDGASRQGRAMAGVVVRLDRHGLSLCRRTRARGIGSGLRRERGRDANRSRHAGLRYLGAARPVRAGSRSGRGCRGGSPCRSEAPVVLVDAADNVGGGSTGDGTVVLDALIRAGARGAVVVIADPEAVAIAEAAGDGGAFDGLVGGKTDDQHGPPVRLRGRVRHIVDGRYTHQGSYMTGYVTTMGRTAVVDVDGITLVLTSLRTMPFDAGQLRSLAIEPVQQRIIVVKSAVAWRAAFGDVARRAIVVDTPSVCASNLGRFAYLRRPQLLHPLESDFGFELPARSP